MKIKIDIPEDYGKSNDIYSDTTREEMLDNDELDPYEAAFMDGYEASLNQGV